MCCLGSLQSFDYHRILISVTQISLSLYVILSTAWCTVTYKSPLFSSCVMPLIFSKESDFTNVLTAGEWTSTVLTALLSESVIRS